MKLKRAIFIVNIGNHLLQPLVEVLQKIDLEVFVFQSFQEAKSFLNIGPEVIVFDKQAKDNEVQEIIKTLKFKAKPKFLQIHDCLNVAGSHEESKMDFDNGLMSIVNKIKEHLEGETSFLKLFRMKVFGFYNF